MKHRLSPIPTLLANIYIFCEATENIWAFLNCVLVNPARGALLRMTIRLGSSRKLECNIRPRWKKTIYIFFYAIYIYFLRFQLITKITRLIWFNTRFSTCPNPRRVLLFQKTCVSRLYNLKKSWFNLHDKRMLRILVKSGRLFFSRINSISNKRSHVQSLRIL